MKKEYRQKKSFRLSKILILLTLSFVIKLFFSCTHNYEPIPFNYNSINVKGVDNSGRFLNNYYNENEFDTLYSEAVALKLNLSDTALLYASSFSPNIFKAFSFQTALAFSYEHTYMPNNKIVDVKIKTLMNINTSIKAGDDISEYILCTKGDDFDMYHKISQGIIWLNEIQYKTGSSIILVLQPAVQNTKAQFEISVTLDNGNILSCTTNLFTIIES